MAGNNVRKRLREETTCTLCLDFFTDPVIMECGHNFCQPCILKCWNTSNTFTASCPLCRKTVSQMTSRPNKQLANVVDIAKELNDVGVCESHQEPLKFFCKDDEAPICVVCERSKGHREHCVVPVEEATEEYKDKIRTFFEKSKEELLACKEDIKKQSQDLLDMVEGESQKLVAEFKVLQQLEEEKHLLDRKKILDMEIVKNRDERLARLSEELSSLENTMLEMEDECEKSPHEFLKDITSKLQRHPEIWFSTKKRQ